MKKLWYLLVVPAFFAPAASLKAMIWFWGASYTDPTFLAFISAVMGVTASAAVCGFVMDSQK